MGSKKFLLLIAKPSFEEDSSNFVKKFSKKDRNRLSKKGIKAYIDKSSNTIRFELKIKPNPDTKLYSQDDISCFKYHLLNEYGFYDLNIDIKSY